MLGREVRRSGVSFKHAVNHFLRLGLSASKNPKRKPFVVTPRDLGLPRGMTYDNVGELLEHIEGPLHK